MNGQPKNIMPSLALWRRHKNRTNETLKLLLSATTVLTVEESALLNAMIMINHADKHAWQWLWFRNDLRTWFSQTWERLFQTSGRLLAGQYWTYSTQIVVGGRIVQMVVHSRALSMQKQRETQNVVVHDRYISHLAAVVDLRFYCTRWLLCILNYVLNWLVILKSN